MNISTARFVLTAVTEPERQYWVTNRARLATSAANLGWDDPARGLAALSALSVGETLTDDDDDTWERIS